MAGRGSLGEVRVEEMMMMMIMMRMKCVQVTLISSDTWEEMHLNATDGVLVQKSVKVFRY